MITASGLSCKLNVALNLFFVIVLDMSADGVALATVISQAVSVIIGFIYLKIVYIIFQYKGEVV